MSVNITTEPIEIVIDGVSFLMQGDPTASADWEVLLEVEVFFMGDKREKSHKEMLDAMAALAETPQDAETIHGLTCGTKTLKRATEGYLLEVTGFPTQPAKSSTKASRRTGGN